YYGIAYHSIVSTHLDALCHVWDADGMWGGRRPEDVIQHHGVTWAGIEHWSGGIVTRGILFDIPRHRGTDFVDVDEPVHDWELYEIARERGIEPEAGDALVLYCGREAYVRAHGKWGSTSAPGTRDLPSAVESRPGI